MTMAAALHFEHPADCVAALERDIWKKPYGSGRQRGKTQVQCQACLRYKYDNERCNLFTTVKSPSQLSGR